MANKPKIYFDTNIFIDLVKYKLNVPFSAHNQKNRVRDVMFCKSTLEASRNSDLQVFTSTVTQVEFLHIGRDRKLDDETKRLIDGMLTSGRGGVVLIQTTQFVTTRARDLAWEDGLNIKGMDRMHLASALEIGCDEFFTVDNDDFIKKAEMIENLGIKVITPSQTGLLPDEYRQMKIEIKDELEESSDKE